MKIKNAIYICLPLMGVAITACDSDINTPVTTEKSRTLIIKAPSLAPEGSGNSELPEQIDLYEFSEGLFVRSQSVNPAEGSAQVSTTSNTKVFAVAGVEIKGVTSETTVEDFEAKTISSPKGAASAPMFHAGVSELNLGDEEMSLELRRGVARIDVACEDPRIVIKEIIVVNAPAESLIVPSDSVLKDAATVSYSLKVGEDFNGKIEQAFTLFESANPVTIRVKGTFDGDLMNFATDIPVVKRNKIYTLGISGGINLDASIAIEEWTQGDNGEGILALGETAFDLNASEIPEGVKIDSQENTITFPASGVKDMKLAFSTKKPLKLGKIHGGDNNITINELEPQTTEEGYLSIFQINVAAQPKCANSYSFTVMFNGGNNFFVNMEVESSPYQIPTVRIGGHEWMCFNTFSNDVEDQIYILDGGQTIEEMYNEHFADCIGNYFQYGKPNPFNPWTASDPSQFADQTMNRPWTSLGMVPLPKGFHVPTVAEWADLIPYKTTIPASYMTASGDSIKATLVTLPGTLVTPSEAVNAKNFKMRYVLFESITTGAKLYLPIAGLKAAATDEIPGYKNYRFDTNAAYWTRADRDILFITYKALEGDVEGAYFEQGRWGYEGLVSVRGVKD